MSNEFIDIIHGRYRYSYKKTNKPRHKKRKSKKRTSIKRKHKRKKRRYSRKKSQKNHKFGVTTKELIAKARKAVGSSPKPSIVPKDTKKTTSILTRNTPSIFDYDAIEKKKKDDTKKKETEKQKVLVNNKELEDRAMKVADMLDSPGQYDYILSVFKDRPNLTPSKFMEEIEKHKQLMLSIPNVSLMSRQTPPKDKEKIDSILSQLGELEKLGAEPPPVLRNNIEQAIDNTNMFPKTSRSPYQMPNNPYGQRGYIPPIGNMAPPFTPNQFRQVTSPTGGNQSQIGRNQLANNMALYANMTNLVKPVGRNRYKTVADKWGYEMGMSPNVINNKLKPFLEEMLPLLEEYNPDYKH